MALDEENPLLLVVLYPLPTYLMPVEKSMLTDSKEKKCLIQLIAIFFQHNRCMLNIIYPSSLSV